MQSTDPHYTAITFSVLEHALGRLEGQLLWGIVGGKPTGSVLNLLFGAMVPRSRPIHNPHLQEEVRFNDAEFSLFVQCAWRLDSADGVVCGCWETPEDRPRYGELDAVKHQLVRRIAVSRPAADLAVEFVNGLTLKLFCDQTHLEDDVDNYHLALPEATVVVGCRSELTRGERGA